MSELDPAPTDEPWRRLSPFSPLVTLGRSSVALVAIAVPVILVGRSPRDDVLFYLPVLAVLIVSAVVRWRVTRWRVRGAVLEKEEGLFRRNSLRFPLVQVQAIDIVRPGPARLLGLAELELRMGGSTHASGRLAYLRADEATELRALLLKIAHAGTAESTATPAEGERVIVTTPTGRLVAGLALSDTILPLLLLLAILLAARFVGIGAGVLVSFAGLGATAWRRFNGEYRLTVAVAHDGLRLRGGLLGTRTETIRRGRVQAVKLVEPILWRPFGWCRLQIALAGHEPADGEGRIERRAARTLLPVGSRRQVDELLEHLLPDRPTDHLRPPARARVKTPLRYRNLSWGRTERCVVTTSGRFTRVTSWVPLEKVQSLRQVEGPLQRKLQLATIHLDTAGRGVRAALRDRDRGEADAGLAELVGLCRRARRAG